MGRRWIKGTIYKIKYFHYETKETDDKWNNI